MQSYVATKIVNAMPMSRKEYNDLRGWAVPEDENPNDQGYLVEYPDSEPNVKGYAGYVSWCPCLPFEKSNQPLGEIGHLPPHVQRMVGELAMLDTRITDGVAFTKTTLFAGLSLEARAAMSEQLGAMSRYSGALTKRLHLIKENK